MEASEISIDLQEQKNVVQNFLWVPQSMFPTLKSTVQME